MKGTITITSKSALSRGHFSYSINGPDEHLDRNTVRSLVYGALANRYYRSQRTVNGKRYTCRVRWVKPLTARELATEEEKEKRFWDIVKKHNPTI